LAERRLSNYRQRIAKLSHGKDATRITFGALADRWLETASAHMKPSSALRRNISIAQLKKFFGSIAVRNITAKHCDEWVIGRGKLISASSFNNERDTLNLIFEHAMRDGLILDNPADAIARRKMSKGKTLIPTKEQFITLVETIRAAGERARPGADLVELLAYSGMRLAEATALKWGDVDFNRGCFTITGGEKGTKNREVRTVPLFPALRHLLERTRGQSVPASEQRVIPIDSAKKAIEHACRRAGLPHYHHHCLRHYFVSNAIEAGVDFKVIAGWVGHKDGGVLVAKTYGHLRDAHSFEMAKRMTFQTDQAPPNLIALDTAKQAGN
jgi:integrase